jgi:acetyl esterase/lipase
MKTMFKILGAAAVLIGLGIAGNQISHQTPKPVQPAGQVQQPTTTQTNGKNNTELILRDVSYGPDKRNTMNVFIPKGASSTTPFVLFMHGGAWVSTATFTLAVET